MAVTVAVGNGSPLVAPGTIPGSGAITFPGSVALAGTITGATSVNGTAIAVGAGQGAPAATLGTYIGIGAPTFSAMNGSMYYRQDGVSGSFWYVNSSGANTAGTTWTALVAP